MYICICNQVTEATLREEIQRGSETVRELRENLGVTSQCGKCGHCVKKCLKEHKQLNQDSGLLISNACSA